MCGIVGLLIKNPDMRASLGKYMVPMLVGMTERGPDSAGLAVFTDEVKGEKLKYSLYSGDPDFSWKDLEASFKHHLGSKIKLIVQGNHAVLISHLDPDEVKTWLGEHFPSVHVLSVGHSIDVYKDTGLPADVAERYNFSSLQGTHLVGHTRMATESAVTPAHAHPFTAGQDFCLVHNGSLSNPNSIRRKLEHAGHYLRDG